MAVASPVPCVPLSGLSGLSTTTNTRQVIDVFNDLSQSIVRQRTFRCFPMSSIEWLNPMDMVDTGFYCTGNEDEVRCFSCKEVYRNWRKGDKPDAIHRRISPRCHFLRGISDSDSSSDDDDDDVDDINNSEGFDDVDGLHSTANNTKDYDTVDGCVRNISNNNNNASSSSMRPSLETDDFNTSRLSPRYGGFSPSASSQHSNLTTSVQNMTLSTTITTTTTARPAVLLSKEELMKENARLRTTCHSCRIEKIQTLFLPCRHLVVCEKCSDTMDNCIHCNETILGTVRTYFA